MAVESHAPRGRPEQSPTPNEILHALCVAVGGHLWQLVCSIPGGDAGRGGLATCVVAEMLARALASPDAAEVAAITNFRLDARQRSWRLVPVS